MKIIYRMAVPEDAQELARVRWSFRTELAHSAPKATYEEYVAATADFICTGLQSGEWFAWLAEVENRIVGNVFVRQIRKIPNPRRLLETILYITNVYVAPSQRGAGIGSTLIQQVQAWAKAQGNVDVAFLWRSDDSAAFYQRAGFSPNDEIMEWSADG